MLTLSIYTIARRFVSLPTDENFDHVWLYVPGIWC